MISSRPSVGFISSSCVSLPADLSAALARMDTRFCMDMWMHSWVFGHALFMLIASSGTWSISISFWTEVQTSVLQESVILSLCCSAHFPTRLHSPPLPLPILQLFCSTDELSMWTPPYSVLWLLDGFAASVLGLGCHPDALQYQCS